MSAHPSIYMDCLKLGYEVAKNQGMGGDEERVAKIATKFYILIVGPEGTEPKPEAETPNAEVKRRPGRRPRAAKADV